MRRFLPVCLMVGVLCLGAVLSITPASSWSDGVAGASGAVPEHLRECVEGFEYCKVKVAGCGGCHGDWDAMRYQRETGPGEPVNVPVVDRISAEVWLNGRAENWEYEPGQTYVIDIFIKPWSKEPERDSWAPTPEKETTYSKVAFNLNASAGTFALWRDAAGTEKNYLHGKNVRITGQGDGNYSHAGSRNPRALVCSDPNRPTSCRPYGQTIDNEKQWKGELTNTGAGSNITHTANNPMHQDAFWYRAYWTAPPKQKPHGVAFVMAFMIPNGDGLDSSTHIEGNASKGYSDQEYWDWWSYLIPRKIVCEKGQNQVECNQEVQKFIIPPPPPPDTGSDGPGDGDGGGMFGGTPGFGPEAWSLAIVVSLVLYTNRRRRRGQ